MPPDSKDFIGILVLLLVNSIVSFFEENNASNDIAAFMAHLAPKSKVYQHILIWSSNDVAPFLVACLKTSLGPKLCGQVFWFMWWIISTWWRFSCFENDSVSSRSSYLLPHHGSETYFIIYYQVLRDGRWSKQDVVILVLRDVINIKLGDIILANVHLLEGDPLKINQVLHNYF